MATIDLVCSMGVLALGVGALIIVAERPGGEGRVDARIWVGAALAPVARALRGFGVGANAITWTSLACSAVAGAAAARSAFGAAALAFAVASLADGVDGIVARQSGAASKAGALLDAACDRYGEALFFGGVAFGLRNDGAALVITLLASIGGYMVSYGSAKAEALGEAVPGGWMRRGHRAAWVVAGAALTPPYDIALAPRAPSFMPNHAPLLGALALLAVWANASAVRRLARISRALDADATAAARAGVRPVPAPARPSSERASTTRATSQEAARVRRRAAIR